MIGNMTLIWCEQGRVWKTLEIDNKVHMICFTKENEPWRVLLTDLVEIWIETLTHETMFHKCQTLNPLLTLEAFDWKQLVMDMLNDIPKHIVEASVHQIKLRKDKDFVKLKFSLDLFKGTPQQFWENVTMPLCLSSMELVHQHEILLDLVKRKDEEIAEYKAEGAELVRKYIATKSFDEKLLKTDVIMPIASDFMKIFQSMIHFYDTMILPKSHTKIESEISSSSASENDIRKMDEIVLPNTSKDVSVQKINQDESNMKESLYSEDKKCKYEANPLNSKSPILKLNSISHTIQKSMKKNKKTLSDFIL